MREVEGILFEISDRLNGIAGLLGFIAVAIPLGVAAIVWAICYAPKK